MHIPDAVLDPRVAAATGLVAAGGLAYGLHRLRDRLGDRTTVLMGSTAAFVFAAQMVNFPLYPFPVSGHLLGGVLAAVLLGPWAGSAVIASVLLVQCFLFRDGGLTALGANFINMGLIGSVGGYALYAPIRRAIGGRRGILLGSMVAAWFSVILASGAFAVELAMGGRWRDFPSILGWMALVHSAIGVGEALITGMVVRFLLLTRPDLVEGSGEGDGSAFARWRRIGLAGLGISVAVAIFLGPLASKHPDGLDFVGGPGKFGFLPEDSRASIPAPFPDYEIPGLAGLDPSAASAAAGVIGTLAVFGVGLVMARSFSGKGEAGRPGSFGEGSRRMRLEDLELADDGLGGPLDRLDARLKLVATVGYVIGVVLTPPGWWRTLAAEGAVLVAVIAVSGVSPIGLFRRWLGFLALVAFLAATVAPGHPDRARLGLATVAGSIVARNALAFLAMAVLVRVTPFRSLLTAMGRLGMPRALVSTLRFMERQIHILSDELDRMVRARRSRTFGRSGRLGFSTLAGLIALLFLRSFERGERVHSAMLARGWDGVARSLDDR